MPPRAHAPLQARLIAAEKQVKNLEWESEVLQQRFAKVQSERDELYEKFETSIYEASEGPQGARDEGRGSAVL